MKSHINKEEWVTLFRETGLNEKMMAKWHDLFESRHPEAHQGFLEWLGLPQKEVETIRNSHK